MHNGEKPMALEALGSGQRRLVQRHMGLVHLTLRRCDQLNRGRQAGREPCELFQEGCLALMEAVRTHDPCRHGVFASFAMARIHYAMSRYAHEQHSLIRIPFITQRRKKKEWQEATGDRHRPSPLPRVVRMSDNRKTPSQRQYRRRYAEGMAGGEEGHLLGDMVRECYDRAVSRVVSRMKASPRCTPALSELLDRCRHERWTVPESVARTPIRQLATALGCSIGRVTHCEERFRHQMAETLEADEVYTALRRLGRRRAEGMWYKLTKEDLASLHRLAE